MGLRLESWWGIAGMDKTDLTAEQKAVYKPSAALQPGVPTAAQWRHGHPN